MVGVALTFFGAGELLAGLQEGHPHAGEIDARRQPVLGQRLLCGVSAQLGVLFFQHFVQLFLLLEQGCVHIGQTGLFLRRFPLCGRFHFVPFPSHIKSI